MRKGARTTDTVRGGGQWTGGGGATSERGIQFSGIDTAHLPPHRSSRTARAIPKAFKKKSRKTRKRDFCSFYIKESSRCVRARAPRVHFYPQCTQECLTFLSRGWGELGVGGRRAGTRSTKRRAAEKCFQQKKKGSTFTFSRLSSARAPRRPAVSRTRSVCCASRPVESHETRKRPAAHPGPASAVWRSFPPPRSLLSPLVPPAGLRRLRRARPSGSGWKRQKTHAASGGWNDAKNQPCGWIMCPPKKRS